VQKTRLPKKSGQIAVIWAKPPKGEGRGEGKGDVKPTNEQYVLKRNYLR